MYPLEHGRSIPIKHREGGGGGLRNQSYKSSALPIPGQTSTASQVIVQKLK